MGVVDSHVHGRDVGGFWLGRAASATGRWYSSCGALAVSLEGRYRVSELEFWSVVGLVVLRLPRHCGGELLLDLKLLVLVRQHAVS